jgi:hypothetical protein
LILQNKKKLSFQWALNFKLHGFIEQMKIDNQRIKINSLVSINNDNIFMFKAIYYDIFFPAH